MKDGHIKSDVTKITNKLNRIENAIRKNTEQMRSRGVHASTKNQFCLSFDGENAEEKVWDFLCGQQVHAVGQWCLLMAILTTHQILILKVFITVLLSTIKIHITVFRPPMLLAVSS